MTASVHLGATIGSSSVEIEIDLLHPKTSVGMRMRIDAARRHGLDDKIT
jgi:hypothetical protein